ncbi:MAG TPA: SpoIIE family protein phosphatase [Leptospiraceae bacterium]|nr:SpoIIE family protein phosphatase [Leptospiraceae bacterium]HMY65526.1 SpoIIE family protein phosphatase [Leptospiraceae bacterium]HNF12904.1 SpoIIE family protein phosphatase [Leptospiraceae bacterium]HNF24260.1 SpoIIE family protein phosphatase [Leptospiraceae bacterium]HNI96093.1 SpoIIE family protein phosphatase [Leptospiraceae bacterium]
MGKSLSLEEITRIVAGINTSRDLDSLLGQIMEITKSTLNTQGCSILLYNKEEDCLIFQVSRGEKSDSLVSLKVPRGKGIAGYVADTLEPVIVNDAQNDKRLYKAIDAQVGFTTRNLICVPMCAKGEFIGVLEAVNSIGRENFDGSDVYVLMNLSEMAAIAINNRYLIDELNRRLEEINGLLQASESLSQVKSRDEFLKVAGDLVADVIAVEKVSLIFINPKTRHWKILYSRGLDIEDNDVEEKSERLILEEIIQTRKPVFIENINEEEKDFHRSFKYRTKSFIAIPVELGQGSYGVLSITDKKNGKMLQKTDLKLLQIIASYMTKAFAAMKAREEKEKLQQLKHDLSIASKIQTYSLPKLPERIGDLEIGSAYFASKEIGGDFYDFIYHKEGLFTVLIADVAGKGIPAALIMEYSKTLLSSEMQRAVSPSVALLKTHRQLLEKPEKIPHVEVMAVRIDSINRRLSIGSAGHNRQIFYNSFTDSIELLRAKGIPLGAKIEIDSFQETIRDYRRGDMLFLYTDGITECRNEKDEMYGEERLFLFVLREKENSTEIMRQRLIEDLEKFRGRRDFEDDYSFLIIKL